MDSEIKVNSLDQLIGYYEHSSAESQISILKESYGLSDFNNVETADRKLIINNKLEFWVHDYVLNTYCDYFKSNLETERLKKNPYYQTYGKNNTNQKNNASVKEFNLFDDEPTKRNKTEEKNNINNNINNVNKFENVLESQINNLKECINIQNIYFNQLVRLVVLFYQQVVSIKQLNEQNKQRNNIPFNLLNNFGNMNPNNNININMNPAYVLQQQSFQNYFSNIMNNNLNPTQLNNLNNPNNINFNNNEQKEKKDENNTHNINNIKKDNNTNKINTNTEKNNTLEIKNDIKTNINEVLKEENKQSKDRTQNININEPKNINENLIEIVNKGENQSTEYININNTNNESNNIQK